MFPEGHLTPYQGKLTVSALVKQIKEVMFNFKQFESLKLNKTAKEARMEMCEMLSDNSDVMPKSLVRQMCFGLIGKVN